MSAPKKLKIAVVGCGGWGWQHARVLRDRRDVEFCAVSSRSEEKARARAAEFGVRAYTDPLKMFAAEKPDLVTVSLPNQQHFAVTMSLLQAGAPLLVEKPLVFSLAEADMLLNEAAKRKLFFAINFNHRYAKTVQMAREAIQAGKLGRLIFANWRFGGEGGQGHPFSNLIETQCHGFDMLEYLCGPLASLMAQMTSAEGRGHSTMALALSFANGAVGTLLGSYDSSYAYPQTHLLEINGSDGRVLVEDTVKRYTYNRAGSEIAEVWQAGYFNDFAREFQRTFDLHFDEVLKALRGNLEPPVHASAGRRALELALAAAESFRSGHRINTGS
jgi:predicted dehydrogenase